jgi:O-acetyl-ADP-ribose deacetylase (regulator of RNase III)
MLQALNSALAANAAVLQYAIMPGPAGSACAAGVVLGDMARVSCDAYIVQHQQKETSRNSVCSALFRAGAEDGVIAFEDYVKSLGSERPSRGDVFIANSGGGNSECLIHVVGMGSGGREREYDSVEYQVFAAMTSAMESGLDRIVFPALGTGELGSLSAELSSNIMFNSIYRHWRENDTHAPRRVLVAIDRKWQDYLVFVNALREIAPSEAGVLESHSGSVLTASEEFILTRESVRSLIARLSPQALYTFYFIVKRGDENLRKVCEIQPWFEQVKVLFTKNDRKQLHPIAVEALAEQYKKAVGKS